MLKCCSLLVFLTYHFISVNAQQVDLITPISSDINETSGLIFLNQKLITHNDSGGQPVLYEIDSLTGNVSRTVYIENATNVDWEDITHDDNYIYIGDFGNNTGARTDLKVYRLSQFDYFNTPNDSVMVDTITYSYADQVDFTPSTYSTNFDAEALIAYNDSLYIFTKNWGNNKTNIYSLPKTPGDYQISKQDSINSSGLITGASLTKDGNSIILCGYGGVVPFILELNQLIQTNFSGSNMTRYDIVEPAGYSVQIEAITAMNNHQYYLSSELFVNGTLSGLYKLTRNEYLDVEILNTSQTKIYPNPVQHWLVVEVLNDDFVSLINGLGETIVSKRLLKGVNRIDVSSLENGSYILKLQNSITSTKIEVVD